MAKTAKKAGERIGWDHPLIVLFGIAPGYLLQERFGYTDATWKRKTANWSFCKDINGEPWFSLKAFEEFLASPHASDKSEG